MSLGKILPKAEGGSVEIRSNVLAKNVLLNFLGLSIPLLGGVLTVPAIVHFLGVERFGVFSLVLVVFGYFIVFDFGLGRSVTRFVASALGKGERESVSKILWSSVVLQAILGVVGGLLLFLVTPLLVRSVLKIPSALRGEASASLRWLACSLPFILAYPSFRGLLEAGQRFDLSNLIKIPTNTLIYVLPLVGVLAGSGLPGIFAIIGFSRIATTFVWWAVCRKVFPEFLRFGLLSRANFRPVFSFGAWNMISFVVWTFLMSLDRFMIGALRTVEEVGFYSAPAEVVARFGIISGSLALTLFPAFSALSGRGETEDGARLHAQSLKLTILSVGPLAAVCFAFAYSILRIWVNPSFAAHGEIVFRILAVGQLVNALTVISYSYLQGEGRADLTTKFQIMEIIFFVPLLWVAIRQAGIAGAAAAWTLRAGLDLFLLLGAVRRLGGKALPHRRGQSLGKAFGALAALALGLLIARRLPGTAFWAVGALAVFGYSVWFLILDEDERRGLTKILSLVGLGRWLERIPNLFRKTQDS